MRSKGKTGRTALIAGAALLSACGQLQTAGSDLGLISRGSADNSASYSIPSKPLLPNASLQLTPSYAITLEKLVLGAAVYYFVDPLSPNWHGEMKRLSDDTFSISMRAKRYRSSGGDGESGRVFRRNADEIVRSGGFAEYTILSYSEGIESETLGAVRVTEGVIRVSRK
jgi:hypothetical protein